MTTHGELLVKAIKEKGWLSLAKVYFDNDNTCNIINTLGYVALSESKATMFWLGVQDTIVSAMQLDTYLHMDPHKFGHLYTLIAQDTDCLQHFEYALYSRGDFYWDEQKSFPLPKIPKSTDLDALVKDGKTGLYTGTDTVVTDNVRNGSVERNKNGVSVISFYEDEQFKDAQTSYQNNYMTLNRPYWDVEDYPDHITSTVFASAADVERWKAFYANQKKFAKAIASYTGATDVI